MERTYILVMYDNVQYFNMMDRIVGAWQRKYEVLYHATKHNITQKDAYVIVVINDMEPEKFDVHNWEDKKIWKQPC